MSFHWGIGTSEHGWNFLGGTLLFYHSRAADEKDIYTVCNQVLASLFQQLAPPPGLEAMRSFFLYPYKF
jgi:hypothetical protein